MGEAIKFGRGLLILKEPISFKIDGVSYQADEGMTWSEWCDSSYNTGGYYVRYDNITDGSWVVCDRAGTVTPTSVISSGTSYWGTVL